MSIPTPGKILTLNRNPMVFKTGRFALSQGKLKPDPSIKSTYVKYGEVEVGDASSAIFNLEFDRVIKPGEKFGEFGRIYLGRDESGNIVQGDSTFGRDMTLGCVKLWSYPEIMNGALVFKLSAEVDKEYSPENVKIRNLDGPYFPALLPKLGDDMGGWALISCYSVNVLYSIPADPNKPRALESIFYDLDKRASPGLRSGSPTMTLGVDRDEFGQQRIVLRCDSGDYAVSYIAHEGYTGSHQEEIWTNLGGGAAMVSWCMFVQRQGVVMGNIHIVEGERASPPINADHPWTRETEQRLWEEGN
ncbi:MAG: hypothetical protein ABIE74_04960 [Pseudomonadota bacterium]